MENTAESIERGRRGFARALTYLVAGSIAVAFSTVFIRWSTLPPIATGFWRLTLALPALVLLSGWENRRRGVSFATLWRVGGRRNLGLIALSGFLFAVDISFWNWALSVSSAATANLISNIVPVWVAAMGWVVLGEKFGRRFALGMVIALGGSALLIRGSAGIGAAPMLGAVLTLGATLWYAAYVINVQYLRRQGIAAQSIMVIGGIVTMITMFLGALIEGDPLLPETLMGWGPLIGAGLVSHVMGQGLLTMALGRLTAAFSALTMLLTPAVSVVLAWLLLGEPIAAAQVLGGVVLIAGVWVARRG